MGFFCWFFCGFFWAGSRPDNGFTRNVSTGKSLTRWAGGCNLLMRVMSVVRVLLRAHCSYLPKLLAQTKKTSPQLSFQQEKISFLVFLFAHMVI